VVLVWKCFESACQFVSARDEEAIEQAIEVKDESLEGIEVEYSKDQARQCRKLQYIIMASARRYCLSANPAKRHFESSSAKLSSPTKSARSGPVQDLAWPFQDIKNHHQIAGFRY